MQMHTRDTNDANDTNYNYNYNLNYNYNSTMHTDFCPVSMGFPQIFHICFPHFVDNLLWK